MRDGLAGCLAGCVIDWMTGCAADKMADHTTGCLAGCVIVCATG